jgi:predicted MPP superfamily phosphohydrolase
MSKIQILSDLHLETPKSSYGIFEITPSAPYLTLLGDIGCVKDPEHFLFLERQLCAFEIVFLLLGNHEPYDSDWTNAKQKLQEFEQEINAKNAEKNLGTFVFLDQTRYDLEPKTIILGCTLFSNILPSRMNDVSFGLNDFYRIQDWTVEQHNEAHASDLAWLNSQVSSITKTEQERRIIILTHHNPSITLQAVDPAHAQSKISSGFATDLSNELCWTSTKVIAWAFGHTHFNCDFVEAGSGKRVVTDQRGYYFQQAAGFDGRKCVEG